MFGIDNAIITGIGGTLLSNLFADERQENQQSFNAAQQERSEQFNSAQAAAQRDWSSQEAATTRDWTAEHAGITRDWTSNEAYKARAFTHGEAARARDYNAGQAEINRQFEERMSSTAIQRRMQDLQSAGINPMLAYGAGGASSPSGSTASIGSPSASGPSASNPHGAQASGGSHASVGMASSGIASPTPFYDVAAGMSNATQAELRVAEAERVRADTSKIRAEEEEIKARTPTHGVNIQATLQSIKESENRIHKIVQDTQTSAASATNIAQQTENLRAQLPHIEQSIKQLRALTTLNYEQAKAAGASAQLSQGQFTEVIQRVKENLPAVEAAFTRARTTNTALETLPLQSRANVHGAEHEGQKLGTILELGQAISKMIPGIGILIGGGK